MTIGFGFARRLIGSRLAILAAAFFAASAMMNSSALSADVYVTNCGAPISSTVKTFLNGSFTTTSSTYVNVPNAYTTINVPTGQTKCVRVRFSATASCSTPNDCLVKVDDPNGFLGAFAPVVSISSESTPDAHSFEWAARLSAGSHLIRIKALASSGSTLTIDSWTLAVDTAK